MDKIPLLHMPCSIFLLHMLSRHNARAKSGTQTKLMKSYKSIYLRPMKSREV